MASPRSSRLTGLLIIVAALLSFTTCGLLSDPNGDSNLKIVPKDSFIIPGMTAKYFAYLVEGEQPTIDITGDASWSTSNADIAQVAGQGSINAKLGGIVFIGTEYKGKFASIRLTVGDLAPTPMPAPGNVAFSPSTYAANIGTVFSTEIRINTGDQRLAYYTLQITFPADKIMLESANAIQVAQDGFMDPFPSMSPGSVTVTGSNSTGSDPSDDLRLLKINWKLFNGMIGENIPINLAVTNLRNPSSVTIGSPPTGSNMIVHIMGNTPPLGEVWITPKSVSTPVNSMFMTEIHLNAKSALQFKKYDFMINFDPSRLIFMMVENSGTESQTFVNYSQLNTSSLHVWGEHTGGISPTFEDILFMRIQWQATSALGATTVSINPTILEDSSGAPIGSPHGIGATINVTPPTPPKIAIFHDSQMLSPGGYLNFGTVPTIGDGGDMSPPFQMYIKNLGDMDLHLSAITFPSADFDILNAPSPALVLPKGGSHNFQITFDPLSIGPITSDLIITSDDPSNSIFTIQLTGIGAN